MSNSIVVDEALFFNYMRGRLAQGSLNVKEYFHYSYIKLFVLQKKKK